MSLTKIVDGYTPFFGNLNQEEVSSLRERINIRKYESNQRIIESGEWGDSMYLIFQGLVNINKPTQNGKYKTKEQLVRDMYKQLS